VGERHDLPGGLGRRRAEHARAAAADGEVHFAAKALLQDPASAILEIDREVAGILRDENFPTEHFGVPLAGSLLPWIDSDLGNGQSREEWKATSRATRSSAVRRIQVAFDGLCVRIGAMRCHSQASTIKLKRDLPIAEIEAILARGNKWVKVIPNKREETLKRLTPVAVTGTLEVPDRSHRKLRMGGGLHLGVHRRRPVAVGRCGAAAPHAGNPPAHVVAHRATA
jgi:aspartate-semialdehyde dehydrogenase